MTSTAASAPTFTISPNGFDIRIQCNDCHNSRSGSLARTWAGSHTCPDYDVCAEAAYAEAAYERHLEDRGYDDARGQEAWEAQMGIPI